MQQYILDIILIALAVLLVALSAKKGFGKSVLEIAATIGSFVLAYIFSRPLAQLIYDKVVGQMIENSLAKKLEESEITDWAGQVRELAESIPETLVNLGEKAGISVGELTDKILAADVSSGNIAAVVTDGVIKPIVLIIMSVVCAALIFAVASVVLGLLVKLLDKVFKIPVIKSLNTALGAALGLVKAAIAIFVICTVLYLIGGMLSGALADAVEQSKIVSFVNSFNPIIERFG